MRRTKVFVSYSHLDVEWQARLLSHLTILVREGRIDLWADTQIAAGSDWRRELNVQLKECRIAVLLVSANFLGSPFIREAEVENLLDRHIEGGLELLPVIARPCAWRLVDWLARLQCRPADDRALSTGSEADVDRDLAMLTYEVAMRVGMGGPAAAEAMGHLARTRTSQPIAASPAARPAASPANLAGCAWRGVYASMSDGSSSPMALSIESDDGDAFRGATYWPGNASTAIAGQREPLLDTTAGRDIWAQVSQLAVRPLSALRFTDRGQQGDGRLELDGDYRAVLQTDMTMVGLWYRARSPRHPIGRFELQLGR
jgi:hypothetical protein